MRGIIKILVAVFCIVVFSYQPAYSEGTKQVMPTSTSFGQLCINKSRNDFAFYNAADEYKLNITIADTAEDIRFGFGSVIATTNTDLIYRIKDPDGTIVFGPFPIPVSGVGYIPSYTTAIAGPFPAAGGFNYIDLQPLTTGDYSLEFYYPPASNL